MTTWTKSSYSGGGGSNCVELGVEVSSSFCASASCVMLAGAGAMIALRDSKHPDGPVLHFSKQEIEAFLLGVKAGEFDHLLQEPADA